MHIFIDREAREIMHLVVSVRPSVRPSMCVCLSALCVCNQGAYADNLTDAVDWLLPTPFWALKRPQKTVVRLINGGPLELVRLQPSGPIVSESVAIYTMQA